MGKTIRQQVWDFHEAFNQPIGMTPAIPPENRVRLRINLVTEEFCEFLEAMGLLPSFVQNIGAAIQSAALVREPDLEQAVDAMGDIDFVVEGTRLEFGVNGEPVAEEIYRSNMAKVGGKVRADGKHLKPAGWTRPDIRKVLMDQGWDGKL